MLLKNNSEIERIVNVVDVPMGGGKTSAAIKYIEECDPSEKILFATPYEDEGKRIRNVCRNKEIVVLKEQNGTKTNDLSRQLAAGSNIASTHALIEYYTDEIIDKIQKKNYTLIIDEAYSVIKNPTGSDFNRFKFLLDNHFVEVDEPSHNVRFTKDEYADECKKFAKGLSKKIESGSVSFYGNKLLTWEFPIKILDAFKRIIVMTYMFDAQPISYYLKMHGYKANKVGVHRADDGTFDFCPLEESDGFPYNISEKIHILDKEKLNRIGNTKKALSSGWYKNSCYGDQKKVLQLGRNIRNVQKNIFKCRTKDFLWTSYEVGRSLIEDKNITNRFLSWNQRAINKYGDVHYLAYAVNCFYIPNIYNYFKSRGYTMDIDKIVLADMVQWIWRSAIRNGDDIWIYIPSKRMRTLLQNWIKEVSENASV